MTWPHFNDAIASQDRVEIPTEASAFIRPFYLQYFNFHHSNQLCKGLALTYQFRLLPQHLIFNRGSLDTPYPDSPYPNREAIRAINSVFFLHTELRLRPKGISLIANRFYNPAKEFHECFQGLAPISRLIFYGLHNGPSNAFDDAALLNLILEKARVKGALRYVSLSQVRPSEPLKEATSIVLEALVFWLVYSRHFPTAGDPAFPNNQRMNTLSFREAHVDDLKYLAITYGFFGRVEFEHIPPTWLHHHMRQLGRRIMDNFSPHPDDSDSEEVAVSRARRAANCWGFAWRFRRYEKVAEHNHALSFLRPDGYVAMIVLHPTPYDHHNVPEESIATCWRNFYSQQLKHVTTPNDPFDPDI